VSKDPPFEGSREGEARPWLLALALVALTLAAYHPAWNAGFIWDDDKYVTQNPLLTAPDGLRRIWFSLDSPSQYFPLTYTTFYLERAVWGLNPAGYHRINILLHLANALLVWGLLTRLAVPGAWLAAALFALHPVQVETVAWITERKNLLMGFFFLLTLLSWTKFIEEKTKQPWRFYALALVLYALALCAKTTACTLPAALWLILWWEKRPIGWRRWAQIAPFVALGLMMGLVTIWWERNKIGTHGPAFAIGPLERILIASRGLWFYLGKLFWPVDLTFSYPRWTISPQDPAAYVWPLATAALGVAIWWARKWAGRGLEAAALFFAATLSPVLGFVMMVTFLYSFVADHYQYLACLGPIALVSAGLTRWGELRRPLLQPAFCAGLLVVLAAVTWQQCGIYRNEETLWRGTLARNPGSWMAENNLGLALVHKGQRQEAIAHFRQALRIKPDDGKAMNNLGNALVMNGELGEAIAQYRQALETNPADVEAHFNLGNALVGQGNVQEAVAQFRAASALKPANIYMLNALAWWLATAADATVRNGTEALALAEKAVNLGGDNNPILLQTLAAAYAETGRYAEASQTARRAEQIASAQQKVALARKLREEIHLYDAGLPMRQSR
jgi:tetratricopeptide (TPR) repeat protein